MNTFDKWLESDDAQKLEVVDIPKYTEQMEAEQNLLKVGKIKSLTQGEQDRLDYLEFLEGANKFKVKDTQLALLFYKRSVWEQEV